MMMAISEHKVLSCVVIVALISALQLAVNASRRRRVRQLPVAVLSAVFMIAGVWLLMKYRWVITLLCTLSVVLADAEILALNIVLMLGFAAARLVLLPVLTAVFRSHTVLKFFSLGLYQYSEDYNEWFLKKKWVNYRAYFFAIACAVDLASGVFAGLTWQYGRGSAVWVTVVPCAAAAVLNEVFNYLNGQTKEEFEHSVMGDAADARRISSYFKVREVLEQLLPGALLSAHTGCEYMGTQSAADYLKERRDTGDSVDRATAEYFDVGGRYKTADVDRVQATFQLMHRRNVIFFDPFYRDLEMYVTFPLVRALLSGKKCVVVCGRKTAVEDVTVWMSELLCRYSHMRTLWRVKRLGAHAAECEAGILAYNQVYDRQVIEANREFWRATDFVLLVEPSMMLNTSQIALSILAEEMRGGDEPPVYCVCDRYTDGLVDTLSHLLRVEIADVVAAPVPRCVYTGMAWNADGDFCRQQLFDKQTKYLGGGVELAAIAVKNQIPKVSWHGETKVPMKDVKWITGQYYPTICRYMNQPSQQERLYEKLEFIPNLWSSAPAKDRFIIAEDEFCNMFSMMRAYLSRGRDQAFVNVMSESYLLRDYMRCNRQMFLSDPNAIPSLVPDYAKTERNLIMKLILMMTLRPVSDEEIMGEFRLVGIETQDVFDTVTNLLHKYTYAENSMFTVRGVRSTVDEFTIVSSCVYSIAEEEFEKYFSDSLKNAYYILEDEKEEGYIDARLFGHVTQTVLPGQLVTYDGKYYMVRYISPQSGVVLHRASNQFNGRKYYRQARRYWLDSPEGEVVSARRIGDVEFVQLRTDLHVDTTGYVELRESHDLRTAKVIDLTDDPATPGFHRRYRNKSVLRIRFPEADSKLQFTVCMLLSEVFRSVFPQGWQYLAVVARQPEDVGGILNYMVYPAEGCLEDGCIYVIEDSDIDLGLLNAVEKNFTRLMEIVADFLAWHLEKMREPAYQDPVPVKAAQAEAEARKKRGLVVRMLDRIRRLFGKPFELREAAKTEAPAGGAAKEEGKEAPEEAAAEAEAPEYALVGAERDGPEEDRPPEVAPAGGDGDGEYSLEPPEERAPAARTRPEDRSKPVRPQMEPTRAERYPENELISMADADPDLVHIDGTDIFDGDGMPEDNDYLEASFEAMGLTPITRSRYQRECFLKFGYEEIDSRLRLDDLHRYLRVRGWCDNALTQARKREVFVKTGIDLAAVNHCDFCGIPLSGVSYEQLIDGRVRCNDCSGSAIARVEDFRELFYRCMGLMENFYSIRFRVPISVKMADARAIAKGTGMVFKPSTRMTARVLGYAQRRRGKFSMVLENGSPRLATTCTMAHELTHIWQYINWKDSEINSVYGLRHAPCTAFANDIVYEGMAVWASIQYLYQIGETWFAAQQEAQTEERGDAYGIGFRLYREQYPLVKDSSLIRYSPFMAFPPLEPDAVKNEVRAWCAQEPCKC